MIEIEKTFLVKQLPQNLSSYQSFKIKQGYLSSTHPVLRIRQKGDKYEITKKIPLKPNDFSAVEEINIPLTKDEFNKLWSLTERNLQKTRYLIPLLNNLNIQSKHKINLCFTQNKIKLLLKLLSLVLNAVFKIS